MSLPVSNSSSSPVSELCEPVSTPPTSPSIALSSNSSAKILGSMNETRSVRIRARGSISKVCDICKKLKRGCDLQHPCESCSNREVVCSYTRYSLNVKFPNMSGHDLNLMSELLNELKESKTTSSLVVALNRHSDRLGINLNDLLKLEDARHRLTSSPSSSAEEEEDGNDDGSYRLHCSTSALNPSTANIQNPSTPRHNRRTRANSNSARGHFASNSSSNRDGDGGGLPSLHTGAEPSPLPPFSVRLVDPLSYHFPNHQLSKMNRSGGERDGEEVVN
ncbi:hypothetical protein JCM5350_004954 [Sporobolomyces pararoseus]